jgi:hypothetical protein
VVPVGIGVSTVGSSAMVSGVPAWIVVGSLSMFVILTIAQPSLSVLVTVYLCVE